jgi:hypothetical protein
MVRCDVGGAPALRSTVGTEATRMRIDGITSFRVAMLIADDLERARTVALYPTFDPREPGVQLFEERPSSSTF